MREIKFRGKRTDNGEWVVGDYSRYSKEKSIIMVDLLEQEDYWVWSETVGQYTGLKDKNGVEIYEGDVLTNSNGRIRTKVEFVLGGFGYRDNAGFFHPFAWETDENGVPISLRVIGNIHDNPELMGEKK